jgi:hypothetical protein
MLLQVMQLTWTGQVQHMASVAASPPPLLAAALTDSLLLLRQNPITGEHEVRRFCGRGAMNGSSEKSGLLQGSVSAMVGRPWSPVLHVEDKSYI